MDVVLDAQRNCFMVSNNGHPIDVAIHRHEKMYVPTLIFGHLLSGGNFDDSEERQTGGQNGIGAKLANIFAHEFRVMVVDQKRKKAFCQTWKHNMHPDHVRPPCVLKLDELEDLRKHTKPKSTERQEAARKHKCEVSDLEFLCDKKLDISDNLVHITVYPDFERLNMPTGLRNPELMSLFMKRVFDMGGTLADKGVVVTLNGQALPGIRSFKDYVQLYEEPDDDDMAFMATELDGDEKNEEDTDMSADASQQESKLDSAVAKTSEELSARAGKKLTKAEQAALKWPLAQCSSSSLSGQQQLPREPMTLGSLVDWYRELMELVDEPTVTELVGDGRGRPNVLGDIGLGESLGL